MLSFPTPEGIFNYRVAGVLIEHGAVLVHRAPEEDFWSLPGGRGEFGEATSDTIRREFMEEIGRDVRAHRLLWVVENFFAYSSQPFHEVALYYEVHAKDPLPREEYFFGRTEDREPPLIFRWVPMEHLPSLRLFPSFLREGLGKLPDWVTHVVHHDTE